MSALLHRDDPKDAAIPLAQRRVPSILEKSDFFVVLSPDVLGGFGRLDILRVCAGEPSLAHAFDVILTGHLRPHRLTLSR
jgi:hypothetical protein